MNRRTLLKSIGAIGIAPMVPALPAIAQTATTTISPRVYSTAEMLVRAHNKCNLGMLQRLLKLDRAAAKNVKIQLVKNGVISTQANAYGLHAAINPLPKFGMLKTPFKPDLSLKGPGKKTSALNNTMRSASEKDSTINDLHQLHDSNDQSVESLHEEIISTTTKDESNDTSKVV